MRKHPPVFRNTYEGDDEDFICQKCRACVTDPVHMPPSMWEDRSFWLTIALFVFVLALLAFAG